MVKKLTKKLKDVNLEITFVAPKEYDVKRGVNIKKKDTKRKEVRSPKKKKRSRLYKFKKQKKKGGSR